MTPDDLRAYRERHNLSQAELAGRLGVATTTVSRWESGYGRPPPYLTAALSEWTPTEAKESTQ